ncbi:Mannitol-1-phosphate 5-dehydrogenase [Dirofilaria immitis]
MKLVNETFCRRGFISALPSYGHYESNKLDANAKCNDRIFERLMEITNIRNYQMMEDNSWEYTSYFELDSPFFWTMLCSVLI